MLRETADPHHGRHSSAGPALRPEAAPALAADVSESSERPSAVLLLPAGAVGHSGAVDNPPRPRLQLHTGAEDRGESQQIAGLLLPGPAVPERHAAAAAAAGDVAASGVADHAAAARHDDDGTAARPGQELGRPHQEQHAALHVRRRPDQVPGGREERDERVGRLSRRERQSSAEEQPEGRERVPPDSQIHGEPAGRRHGGTCAHVRKDQQDLQTTRGQEERQAGQTAR